MAWGEAATADEQRQRGGGRERERDREKFRLHNAVLKLTFNLIDYYGCAFK